MRWAVSDAATQLFRYYFTIDKVADLAELLDDTAADLHKRVPVSPPAEHPMDELPRVVIYTDGACDPNPGPGGWAALLLYNDHEKVLTGAESPTTNNRMELTAAIEALQLPQAPLCRDPLHRLRVPQARHHRVAARLAQARLAAQRRRPRQHRAVAGPR